MYKKLKVLLNKIKFKISIYQIQNTQFNINNFILFITSIYNLSSFFSIILQHYEPK